MRVLIDISDADTEFVKGTKEHDGRVIMVSLDSAAVQGKIVGLAVPHSVAGTGHVFTGLYDITLLEEL